MTLGAFPVPGFSSKKYKVVLEASDDKCEALLIDAIETNYHRNDLTEAIYNFAQQCIPSLAAYGYAPYEIVYFSDEQRSPKAFLLTPIIPASFVARKDGYEQYVPVTEKVEQELTTQYIELPAESVLLFELPEEIRASYEHMMDSLSYFGGAIIPRFAMEDLFTQSIPFSQQDYFRSREMAVASATKDIGWNGRDYGTQYELEFYVWYRQLKFYRFQCTLRSLVIAALNEGLRRIGKRLEFEAKLSIDGLPTEADAELAMTRLLSGELKTFHEVLQPF